MPFACISAYYLIFFCLYTSLHSKNSHKVAWHREERVKETCTFIMEDDGEQLDMSWLISLHMYNLYVYGMYDKLWVSIYYIEVFILLSLLIQNGLPLVYKLQGRLCEYESVGERILGRKDVMWRSGLIEKRGEKRWNDPGNGGETMVTPIPSPLLVSCRLPSVCSIVCWLYHMKMCKARVETASIHRPRSWWWQ